MNFSRKHAAVLAAGAVLLGGLLPAGMAAAVTSHPAYSYVRAESETFTVSGQAILPAECIPSFTYVPATFRYHVIRGSATFASQFAYPHLMAVTALPRVQDTVVSLTWECGLG